jgi:NADPH:quinone reductase-like Zn-dependent oxidoreductase
MREFDPTRRAALGSGIAMLAAAPLLAGQAASTRGATMQAYQLGLQQGIDSLSLVERAVPHAGPGEVIIGVRASALNHRDLSILAGQYGAAKPPQRVPVGDGAGIVLECGPGVTTVQVGDRVTAPHFTPWLDGDYDPGVFAGDLGNTRDGWLAERIVLPAAALVQLPASMSFEDAAALGAAGITAWAVLVSLGRIRAGDTVLTLGTGGVSMLALQIAKISGARVAITSSSDAKLELCRALGADITVNYRRTPAWHETVREATGGRGVDIVVETVGLSTLSQSLACCAPNARVGLLGALGGATPGPTSLGPLILNNIVLKGITSGSRRMLDDLLRASAANGLRPRIDRRFKFGEAREALRHLESGDHVGKVVIQHESTA